MSAVDVCLRVDFSPIELVLSFYVYIFQVNIEIEFVVFFYNRISLPIIRIFSILSGH